MGYDSGAILITGGASGLGAATARKLASRFARVVMVDLNTPQGDALAAELGDKGRFVKADVTNEDEMDRAMQVAIDGGMPLQAAVCCAGIGTAQRLLDRDGRPHDLSVFKRIIDVNLTGVFNTYRLAAAYKTRNDPDEHGQRGVLVATASVAAYEGQIGQVAYAASKAGIVGLTLPAARDLSKVGIRVLGIAPGIFDTPMLAGVPEKFRSKLGEAVPFPSRIGSPEEYAALVETLLDNRYLNGEVIRIDGALRLAPR